MFRNVRKKLSSFLRINVKNCFPVKEEMCRFRMLTKILCEVKQKFFGRVGATKLVKNWFSVREHRCAAKKGLFGARWRDQNSQIKISVARVATFWLPFGYPECSSCIL